MIPAPGITRGIFAAGGELPHERHEVVLSARNERGDIRPPNMKAGETEDRIQFIGITDSGDGWMVLADVAAKEKARAAVVALFGGDRHGAGRWKLENE